ncbi:MAG: IS1380 family transposase, partial [bacterium]|nr:IS1380 family transposase [bacterium]
MNTYETNSTQIRPIFNRSLAIAGGDERLTSLAGVVCLRELDEKLGLTRDVAGALEDQRDPSRVEHSMSSLLRSWTYTMAAHSCTQLSTSRLAMDPALKLAASDNKGVAPLGANGALASQPTLSRFLSTLGKKSNLAVLNDGLFESAARGIRAANKGKRLAEATLDIDSFPHEVHGHQPGAEYNGHYRMNCYHPLGVMVGETGHWVGLDLRDGNVHTANGAGEMLLPLVDKARKEIAEKVYVRGDAGFPGADFLDQLDERDVSYTFRIPTNKALQQWEEILAVRPPGRPPEAPRMWTHNVTYQAATWKAPRRVVVVVQERPGELYLHTFFILT